MENSVQFHAKVPSGPRSERELESVVPTPPILNYEYARRGDHSDTADTSCALSYLRADMKKSFNTAYSRIFRDALRNATMHNSFTVYHAFIADVARRGHIRT